MAQRSNALGSLLPLAAVATVACLNFACRWSAMRDEDGTALAVLALLACVAHRLECSDFVN